MVPIFWSLTVREGTFVGWDSKYGFVGRTWLNLSPNQINPWKARLQIPSSEFQESLYYICFWVALTDLSSHFLAFILFPISNYVLAPVPPWTSLLDLWIYLLAPCQCQLLLLFLSCDDYSFQEQPLLCSATAGSILSYSDHRINLFK